MSTFVLRAELCPKAKTHTPCPEGYVAWHEWSYKKYRTHYQVRCPECNLFAIWVKRDVPLTPAQVEAAFWGETDVNDEVCPNCGEPLLVSCYGTCRKCGARTDLDTKTGQIGQRDQGDEREE